MLNASGAVAELIDSIYETIERPDQWHSVFDQISAYLQLNNFTPTSVFPQTWQNDLPLLEQLVHHPLLNTIASADGADIHQLSLHIRRALQLSHMLIQRSQQADTSVRLLDAIGAGILIVRIDGEIAYINPAARKILNSNTALSIKTNRLWSPNTFKYQRLKSLIASIIELAHVPSMMPEERHLAIHHQNDVVFLHLSLVAHETDRLPWMNQLLIEGPMVMLQIRDLKQGLSVNASQQLAAVYHLSKAELNIARLVAEGLQVNEISDLLQLSANTIRAQLKAIYKKTNTGRQSELMQLLLRFEQ
ncbi:helix-turn-helix transcriptional regulator [Methylophilus aquaticus]|uniref:LuxR C-terminal-related transcriptional regulator n=1 Tax=Methylophilus aquaticus TaxID=1971610 RepID=A0ABT9JWS1_9PROT|nr:helix-turn-helix transcriptional regulator [Methylophilus aquaticus]MDP8568971.1 LuxR C-terminal-related transcriptional regulator [Methylophilus aquaticus]